MAKMEYWFLLARQALLLLALFLSLLTILWSLVAQILTFVMIFKNFSLLLSESNTVYSKGSIHTESFKDNSGKDPLEEKSCKGGPKHYIILLYSHHTK